MRLRELCKSQLKVGSLGFGGPLSAMAFMRQELVVRHRAISDQRYLEGLALVKLMPGPVSTLLAIFLGQEIAGTRGGFLSGLCYVLPAFAMILAVVTVESSLPPGFRESTYFVSAMSAVQAAVLSVIFWTCWKLFREAVERPYAGRPRRALAIGIAALAGGAAWAGSPELLILALASVLGAFALRERTPRGLRVDPVSILWVFLTAGVTVFGTGYMVLPHLQRVLCVERAWLSPDEFLNAVAWGNLTPGPIVIASTYMGYKMLGLRGALAATVGIFAAPFGLMLALGPWVRRFLGRPWVEGVMLGLIPAVAATIAVGTLSLARDLRWDLFLAVVFAMGFAASARRVAVPWIFAGALVLGIGRAWFMMGPG